MDLLLQAALRLFVSQGYRSSNLEQISGAAQLTKGAVYFYFGSKEAVLLELLRRVQDVVVDRAIAAVKQVSGGATDKLVAYVHHQASLGITHRDEVLLLILMSLEFKEREGEVQSFIRELYARQRSFIDWLIAAGQKSGEFRNDVPVREMSAIVQALDDGTFLEWFRRSDHLGGADLTRGLRTTLLNGILAAPTEPRRPRAPRAATPAKKPKSPTRRA
jgi:AcrR family transcriptional regulator